MFIPVILAVCALIGLKCSLLGQFVVLACFIIFFVTMFRRDMSDSFVVALTVLMVFWIVLGMGLGDLYYYCNYYDGTTHISDVLSWFVKP